MRRAAILLVPIGCLSLLSCSDRASIRLDSPADPPVATYLFDYNSRVAEIPSEFDREYPIDSSLHFTFFEGYAPYGSPCDPMLVIHQKTDEEYTAYNFSILLDVETSPGLIRIMYRSVFIGNWTADAIGPANTLSFFSVPNGVYTLRLENGDMVDTYQLVAENESFQVRPVQTSFTRNNNEITGRHVRGTFGLYWSGDEVGEDYFLEIAELLRQDNNIIEILPTDQPLNPLWQRRPMRGNNEPLLFSYSGDSYFQAVLAMLGEFTRLSGLYRENARIAAVSWRDEIYVTID